MDSELKITSVKPIHADAAWAAYTFVKVETDGGITGYAEVSDWRMPQAVAGGVKDLATILTGQDALNIEARCQDMYRLTCQGPGGVIQRAIGGVECALWDIKGKALNQPVYELLGASYEVKFACIGPTAAPTERGTPSSTANLWKAMPTSQH